MAICFVASELNRRHSAHENKPLKATKKILEKKEGSFYNNFFWSLHVG
jgi:DNA-directed RNA polymerase beta' subunit